jgi:16S rRNA (guanine966-N2)-methyltransferase
MRIVGGQYRGKKLFAPEGRDIRPTSERAREAIFNILASKLGGDYGDLLLADIFTGTGAFGLEAISRGFAGVTLLDKDISAVMRNVKMFTREANKISVIKANATVLPRATGQFNVIFADAPYDKGLTEKVLQELILKNWPAENCLCIIEVRKDENIAVPDDYEQIDERIYGLAKVLFLLVRKK